MRYRYNWADKKDHEEDHAHLSESPKYKGSASSPHIDDLFSRVINKVEGSDDFLKGMIDYHSSLNSEVNSHVDATKMLEGQFNLLSTQLTSKTLMEENERGLVVFTLGEKVTIGNLMGYEDPHKHEHSQGMEEYKFTIQQNLSKDPHELAVNILKIKNNGPFTKDT